MSCRFDPWVGNIPWRRKCLIHVLNTYQIVHFICSLLHVNYTSINFLKRIFPVRFQVQPPIVFHT